MGLVSVTASVGEVGGGVGYAQHHAEAAPHLVRGRGTVMGLGWRPHTGGKSLTRPPANLLTC